MQTTGAKKAKLHLHIGRHKTGTSSIQHWFADHEEILKSRGVLYPQAGRSGVAHHALSGALKAQSPEALDRDLVSRFRRETQGFDRVVVSSEDLQNVRRPEALQEAFEGFHLHVICYMREIVDYAVSAYAQLVHAQNYAVDFEYFTWKFDLALRKFVDFWTAAADETSFIMFDRESLFGRDVVPDFLERTTTPHVGPYPDDKNPSISGNLLHFKFLSNALGVDGRGQYEVYAALARDEPRFRGKFSVDGSIQKRLRASPFNAALAKATETVPKLRDFTDAPPVFDPGAWPEDLERIAAEPALAENLDIMRARFMQ